VHDQDHAAKEPSPRWAGARGSAWQPAGTHGFQIKPAGAAVDWLHYHHMRPGNDGKARQSLVTDFLSYNSYALAEFDHTTEENWVGDLMVECEVDIANARGELWLELGRGAERIQARLQLASGEAALIRSGAAPRELARKAIGAKLTGKHRLRFANFDQRATLWIDDDLPFGDGVAHERPSKPGPTSADLEPVRIGSAGASVRIHRLKLWRDVYWSLRPARADHDARDDRRVEWFDPATWDALRDARSRFAFVQPGHYFMLGDNPMYCSDSRDWGVAPVPALRGRPLLRYWPPERIGQLR